MRRNKAMGHADRLAAWFRSMGYPEAEAAHQYCIDEIGEDNFYTYTVSVYVGKKAKPKSRPKRKFWNWGRPKDGSDAIRNKMK